MYFGCNLVPWEQNVNTRDRRDTRKQREGFTFYRRGGQRLLFVFAIWFLLKVEKTLIIVMFSVLDV